MTGLIRTARRIAAVAGCVLWTLAHLAAQEPAKDFQLMKPGDPRQESLPSAQLVYAAYAIVWLVLLGYLFILWRRASRIERGLAAVNDRLEKR